MMLEMMITIYIKSIIINKRILFSIKLTNDGTGLGAITNGISGVNDV